MRTASSTHSASPLPSSVHSTSQLATNQHPATPLPNTMNSTNPVPNSAHSPSPVPNNTHPPSPVPNNTHPTNQLPLPAKKPVNSIDLCTSSLLPELPTNRPSQTDTLAVVDLMSIDPRNGLSYRTKGSKLWSSLKRTYEYSLEHIARN